MNFPLYPMGSFSEPVSLVLAILIGIGFGFILERGGLGNSLKLSRQFYLKDLTVFKVMFTAIVTAMTGIFWLAQVGFIDLSMVYFSPSYILPQAVAGILFGVGFIMAGLCPGTSCVAVATGKMDGLAVMGGIFAGVTTFALIFPVIEPFYYYSGIGQVTLPQILGISSGLTVVIVILVAGTGFYAAERIEGNRVTFGKKHKIAGVLSVFLFLVPTAVQEPAHYPIGMLEESVDDVLWGDRVINGIGVHELANMIISRQDSMLIIDLRTEEEFENYHIPGSVLMNPTGGMSMEKWLILVSNLGDTVPLSLMRNEDVFDKLYILKGGIQFWKEKILYPDLTWTKLSADDRKKAARISRYFGGDPLLPRTKPGSPGSQYIREGC